MYPIIYNYKFINIGTYGILLGLAFYAAFLMMERELELRNKNPELAYKLLLVIIPSAIIGAKLFHIFENMSEFLHDPRGMIFSGAGLSVQGGFILSFITTYILVRVQKENILEIFDMASPAMAIGYGIGRIGCHVSGDGCYGKATTSFLGTPYPNGLDPTIVNVFPTPLFESFASFMIFVFLLNMRKREMPIGKLFFIYLILNGVARFMVEFIRKNPEMMLGLTQAQVLAILFVLTGVAGWILVDMKARNITSK
jgi:phosphatidylglycerol:prolipoprotein diacylglycerol transferase